MTVTAEEAEKALTELDDAIVIAAPPGKVDECIDTIRAFISQSKTSVAVDRGDLGYAIAALSFRAAGLECSPLPYVRQSAEPYRSLADRLTKALEG